MRLEEGVVGCALIKRWDFGLEVRGGGSGCALIKRLGLWSWRKGWWLWVCFN